jgi:hypothetical protein
MKILWDCERSQINLHRSLAGRQRAHRISVISMAKEERPSTGASAEKVRSMKASMKGTVAASQGANSPHAPNSATVIVPRITVLLPAMFGPASMITTLRVRPHHPLSLQYYELYMQA